jgi:hypothetical protein
MTHHVNLTAERILAQIEKVIQSRDLFLIEGNLLINFIYTRAPGGKGSSYKPKNLKIEDMVKNKRSIVQICNRKDTLCLARALHVAKTYCDYPENNIVHRKIRTRARKNLNKQKLGAEYLHRKANLKVEKREYGLEDVKKFQESLPDYQLVVISKDFFNGIVYKGPINSKKQLILYEVEKHYHVITSFRGFFSNINYFCNVCLEHYHAFRGHAKCRGLCNLCLHPGCTEDSQIDWKYCSDCNRYFKSQLCLSNHNIKPSIKSLPICEKYAKCTGCNKILPRYKIDPDNHHCGSILCKYCKQWVLDMNEHKCFIQTIPLDKIVDSEKKMKLYFYDFETDQSCGEHIPILVVLRGEGDEEWVFEGKGKCLEAFCDFVLTKEFSNSIFLGHNAGAFDMYFVMNYIYNKGIKINTLYRESIILQIVLPIFNITFKDSYLFIPTRLSNFPSIFGFGGSKSYFPHLFPYSDYEGPYVDKKYYDYEGMKSDDREIFNLV